MASDIVGVSGAFGDCGCAFAFVGDLRRLPADSVSFRAAIFFVWTLLRTGRLASAITCSFVSLELLFPLAGCTVRCTVFRLLFDELFTSVEVLFPLCRF